MKGFGLATALVALSAFKPTVDAKEQYVVKEDITTKEHDRP